MNIPVSEFFKNQLHAQVILPMSWAKVDANDLKDYSLHNLNIFNVWQSQTEHPVQHSDSPDKNTPEIIRIEHKLDLVINLFQQFLSQQQDTKLTLTTVLVSVSGIRWLISDKALQLGETLLILLSLEASPLPVYLHAKVIEIEVCHGGVLCTARFLEQSEKINELMDRWIFKLHRREISNLRHR